VEIPEFIKFAETTTKEIFENTGIVEYFNSTRLMCHVNALSDDLRQKRTMLLQYLLINMISKNELLANIIMGLPLAVIEIVDVGGNLKETPTITGRLYQERTELKGAEIANESVGTGLARGKLFPKRIIIEIANMRNFLQNIKNTEEEEESKNLLNVDYPTGKNYIQVLEWVDEHVDKIKLDKYLTEDFITTAVALPILINYRDYDVSASVNQIIKNITTGKYTTSVERLYADVNITRVKETILASVQAALTRIDVKRALLKNTIDTYTSVIQTAENALAAQNEFYYLECVRNEEALYKLEQTIERVLRHPLVDWIELKDKNIRIHTKNIPVLFEMDKIRILTERAKTAIEKGYTPVIGKHIITVNIMDYTREFFNKSKKIYNYHVEEGRGCVGTFASTLTTDAQQRDLTKYIVHLIQILQSATIGDPWGNSTLQETCVFVDDFGIVMTIMFNCSQEFRKEHEGKTHINEFINIIARENY
jgi:hypothetical protein